GLVPTRRVDGRGNGVQAGRRQDAGDGAPRDGRGVPEGSRTRSIRSLRRAGEAGAGSTRPDCSGHRYEDESREEEVVSRQRVLFCEKASPESGLAFFLGEARIWLGFQTGHARWFVREALRMLRAYV